MARVRKRTVEVISPGPMYESKRLIERHGVLIDETERLAYIEAGEFWEFGTRWFGGELRPIRRFQVVNRDRDVALDLSSPKKDWSSGDVSTERRFELQDLFGLAEYARLEQKKPADRMFQAIALAIIVPAILMLIKVVLRGFQPPTPAG